MADSAKVEILIDAVTEAAQEAVEQVGDELNNLSADAKPATQAMDSVGEELDDTTSSAAAAQSTIDDTTGETRSLALAMHALKSRADEAGDQVAQAGAKAGVTSGLFSRLTISTNGLALAFGTLSTAATVSLIPSLLTLSTVLLPLVGIFGGIAAAAGSLVAVFGGLAATGVVTHMTELKTALKAAKTEIMDIIQPLGEVFGPLLVDAVQALPTLVQRIVNSLGPLQQFADALRELGGVLMTAIPAATGVMFDLAERALPVVIDTLRTLMDVGPQVADAVSRAFQALGPPLMAFGQALADILPTLYDLGITVGQLVIPALTRMTRFADQVAEFVLGLQDNLRKLTVAAAITAPAIFSVASSIGALFGPLGLAAAAVTAFVAAFKTNFLGIRDITEDVVGSVVDRLQAFRSRLTGALAGIRDSLGGSAFAEGLAASIGVLTNLLHGQVGDAATSAKNALRSFATAVRPIIRTVVQAVRTGMTIVRQVFDAVDEQVATLGQNIMATFGVIASIIQSSAQQMLPIFDIIGDTLTQASGKFGTLARMAVRALNSVVTVIRTVVLPTIRFVLQNFVIPLLRRLATVWSENFGTILSETIQTINALRSYIRPALKALEGFWNQHGQAITSAVKFAFDAIIGILGTAMDAIYSLIIIVLNLIQGDWEAAWATLKDFFTDALAGVVEFAEKWNIVSTLKSVVMSAVNAVATFLTRDLPGYFIMGLGAVVAVVQKQMAQVYNIFISVFNAISGLATSAFEGIVNTVIDAINGLLSTIDKVADEVEDIPGVDLPDVGRLEQFQLDERDFQAEKRRVNTMQAARQNARTIAVTLGFDVQGEGPLAEFVRQNADASVQDQASEQRRAMERLNIGAGATE